MKQPGENNLIQFDSSIVLDGKAADSPLNQKIDLMERVSKVCEYKYKHEHNFPAINNA